MAYTNKDTNLWYELKPILGLSWLTGRATTEGHTITDLWHLGLCADLQARDLNKPVTFGVQLTRLPLEDKYW